MSSVSTRCFVPRGVAATQLQRSLSFGAGSLAFLLYVATLSNQYSADSLIVARAVETSDWRRLVDPNHPLTGLLGWAFYQAWTLVGRSGGAMLPLQVLNALGGAAVVAIVHRIGLLATASSSIPAFVAAGCAVSGGLWLLSTEAEFVTVPLAINLFVLLRLLESRESSPGPCFAVRAGVFTGLAIAAYLTSASLILVAALVFCVLQGNPMRSRIRNLIIYVLTAAITVAPFAAMIVAVNPDLSGWRELAGLYSGDPGYGRFLWFNLPHGAYAFLRSLVLYPGLGMNDRTSEFLRFASWAQTTVFLTYYAIVALAASAPLMAALIWRRRLVARHGGLLAILFVWVTPLTAFAFYWVPGDVSFWMATLVVWWLLAGLVIDAGKSEKGWFLARRSWGFAAVAIVLLACLNARAVILPHYRHDPVRPDERPAVQPVCVEPGSLRTTSLPSSAPTSSPRGRSSSRGNRVSIRVHAMDHGDDSIPAIHTISAS